MEKYFKIMMHFHLFIVIIINDDILSTFITLQILLITLHLV